MSRVDRTVISRGPAVVKFNGGIFFSEGDITLDWNIQNTNIKSSAFGSIEPWRQRVKPTLKMTLVGQIASLPVLFPHVSLKPGQSIFGSGGDIPLQICPIDTTQNKTVFAAAAIMDQPALLLGVEGGGPALGATTFAFVPANDSLPTDSNAWFTSAENDYDGTGFDPTQILIQAYSCQYLSAGTVVFTVGANSTAAEVFNITAENLATALNALASVTAAGGVTVTGTIETGWVVTAVSNNQVIAITGAVTGMPPGTCLKVTTNQAASAGAPQIVTLSLFPFFNFPAEKAIKVTLKSTVTEKTADGTGVYDMLFSDMTATATFTPMNFSESVLDALINVQGANAALGSSQAALAHNLAIYAPGLWVQLNQAIVTKGGKVYSSEKQRVPDIEFQASRQVIAGVVQPVFYIGTAAPE